MDLNKLKHRFVRIIRDLVKPVVKPVDGVVKREDLVKKRDEFERFLESEK